MPEDYYSDGTGGGDAGGGQDDAPQPTPDNGQDQDESTGQTTLIPKTLLGDGLEPGHVCEVEVVADHGDEYEVKYASPDKDEKPPEPPAPSDGGAQAPAAGGMESMLGD